MIKGQNIICFGSEKWEYPGLQQTVMRLLSSDNRIVYVNSLGTRKLSLKISQFGIYFKRAMRIFEGNAHNNDRISENTLVCNSWMIPLVYNRPIMKFNRAIMRVQFSKLLSKLEFKDYILWAGTPTAASFLDIFKPTVLIYNPVDRYSEFSFVDGTKIADYERYLASTSDAVICTSDAIRNDLKPYNNNCFTVSHGVDVKHFLTSLDDKDIPEDIRNIRGPIIGYFGGLTERVDWELLHDVATRYADANMVLIGKKSPGVRGIARLERLANVHFLGYKDYKVLPDYLKQFTVCLIPYVINDLLVAVDPIKLREYLAMGKPVVSVDLPEVRKLQDVVYIGENKFDFVNMIGKAMMENAPSLAEERIRTAWQSDWAVKIEEISDIVNNAITRRRTSQER